MSRSGSYASHKTIAPDVIYGSRLITKLIACAMWDGNISAARKIVYGAISKCLPIIRQKYEELHEDVASSDDVVVLWFMEYMLSKIAPTMETRTRRIGGMNYQIPFPVPHHRALSLSIKWLLSGARSRKENGMIAKLAAEMNDAINGKGEAMKRRETVRKTVEANRAFAVYANSNR